MPALNARYNANHTLDSNFFDSKFVPETPSDSHRWFRWWFFLSDLSKTLHDLCSVVLLPTRNCASVFSTTFHAINDQPSFSKYMLNIIVTFTNELKRDYRYEVKCLGSRFSQVSSAMALDRILRFIFTVQLPLGAVPQTVHGLYKTYLVKMHVALAQTNIYPISYIQLMVSNTK